MNNTLDMFLGTRTRRWAPEHIELLRKDWAKMDEKHKLYEFNMEIQLGFFEKDDDESLMMIANAEIPHLSDWATIVAKQRSLI